MRAVKRLLSVVDELAPVPIGECGRGFDALDDVRSLFESLDDAADQGPEVKIRFVP